MGNALLKVGLGFTNSLDADYIRSVLNERFGKQLEFYSLRNDYFSQLPEDRIDFIIRDLNAEESPNTSPGSKPANIPQVLFVDGSKNEELHRAIGLHPYDIWLKDMTGKDEMISTISKLIDFINIYEDLHKFKKAVEISPVSLLISDIRGSIIYVNPQFEKVSGYSSDELIGRNPRVLKSGKHNQAFYEAIWEKISAGQIWEGEICNRSKEGKLYTEKQLIVPSINRHNEITHYIGLRIDDTDRRHAEEAMRKAEALRSVKELAGGIAHEFSQPLQVLTISMSMLEIKMDGDELFGRCQRMIRRIIDLVGNLKNITELKQQDYLQTKILDIKKSSEQHSPKSEEPDTNPEAT